MEKTLGSENHSTATTLSNLGELYAAQGRYADAEALLKRSLATDEKMLGLDHPSVATKLNNLAVLYFKRANWASAADFWRRSTSIIVHRAQRGSDMRAISHFGAPSWRASQMR
jgi:tetratricopeptide (TPR) repeat protein